MTFRPKTFEEYIGQNHIKDSLNISIQASRIRNKTFPHILLHGGSGLGKTTLAQIIGNELNAKIHTILATDITSVSEVTKIFKDCKDGDIIFIDEIHVLPKSFQESMYHVLEDNVFYQRKLNTLTYVMTMVEVQLPKFTCIGATTEIGKLSTPFRERFGQIFSLENYNVDEISEIILKSAESHEISINRNALTNISSRCRLNPRVANRLLDRCIDYMVVHSDDPVLTENYVDDMLEMLQIDNLGLTNFDRKILEIIFTKFGGGPVGIKPLASAVDIDEDAMIEMYEPLLTQLEFIEKTSRGRVITQKGVNHIGYKVSA